MKTASELKTMMREMYALSDDGNIAATKAAQALQAAAKTVALAESGFAPAVKAAAKEERNAVAMYDAALGFVTPAPVNGKAPFAIWDNDTQAFVVRHW